MTTRTTRVWSALAIFGLVLAIGCAQDTGVEHPPTYEVTGTVTHNGNPVDGAQVVFVAEGGGQGAVGTTDSEGKYTLTTYEAGDGAEAGEYKVKITKFAGAAPQGEEVSEEEYTGAEDEYWVPENELPQKYADASTSELTASVSEEPTEINFDLSD